MVFSLSSFVHQGFQLFFLQLSTSGFHSNFFIYVDIRVSLYIPQLISQPTKHPANSKFNEDVSEDD